MAQTFADICVRGGGIVGCTAALALAQQRLSVALVLPPTPPAGAADIRAYALNAASRALLESLRAWPDEAATPVARMQVHGDGGGEIGFDAATQGVAALAWIVDVPALEARLMQALSFQPLVTVVDAPPEKAALTVICEGKASRSREALAVQWQAQPCGQHAIACRIRAERSHGGVARQWFGADGSILAFLPLRDGPTGADGHGCAVVWSVDSAQAPQLMALPDEAFAARLGQASHHGLGEVVLAQGARAAWPLQNARASHFSGTGPQGAWVLAGDAAHAVHPLAGQGLNLGLGDVAELAAQLQGREYWRGPGDERVLRRYERARRAASLAMTRSMAGLQELFAHPAPLSRELRNRGLSLVDRLPLAKHWLARAAIAPIA
jgi:2-polyprenyl-6-methoxyphenol hydroxylase-like FAD-dependent oxidoreductase